METKPGNEVNSMKHVISKDTRKTADDKQRKIWTLKLEYQSQSTNLNNKVSKYKLEYHRPNLDQRVAQDETSE